MSTYEEWKELVLAHPDAEERVRRLHEEIVRQQHEPGHESIVAEGYSVTVTNPYKWDMAVIADARKVGDINYRETRFKKIAPGESFTIGPELDVYFRVCGVTL